MTIRSLDNGIKEKQRKEDSPERYVNGEQDSIMAVFDAFHKALVFRRKVKPLSQLLRQRQ